MNKSLANRLQLTSKHKLPVITQKETTESGLVCMLMIASYHNVKTDLATLHRNNSFILDELPTKELTCIADKLGFTSRIIRVNPSDINQLQCPCILQCTDDHFVVLKKVSGKKIIIHDPKHGTKEHFVSDFSKLFKGEAIELTPGSDFSEKETPRTVNLSSFWQNVTGLKRTLIRVFVLSILLQIFVLATPFYMQLIVDDVLVSSDHDLLTILSIGFVLLLFMQIVTSAVRALTITLLSNQLLLQMNANLVRHLFKLSISFFQKRHIGDILSRINSLERIRTAFSTTIVESIVDSLMIIGLLTMMFLYSAKLTFIVLAFSLSYLVIRLISYAPFKKINRDIITSIAKKDTNIMESIRGMQAIKLATHEQDRLNQYCNLNVDYCNNSIKAQRLNISFLWSQELLAGIENILVIFVAAKLVIAGSFSVGMLIAFLAYKTQFVTRASKLIDNLISLKMISLHLERLSDIVLCEPEKNLGHRDENTAISGNLELKGVGFSYSDEKSKVLQNINMSIKAGESVAIIGSSGCGKTTLMKIMLGLIPPSAGTVKIDDISIQQIGLLNYRSAVSSVMQNEQLMSGTIQENISFYENTPNRELVTQCAIKAGIHNDIASMQDGYQSLIGDLGSTLSGGQIQRIILARALYRRPKILFLDEATSNLDIDLENHVNESIKGLKMTRIFIAHRIQTIESADRVFKFNEGTFLEIEKSGVMIDEIISETLCTEA